MGRSRQWRRSQGRDPLKPLKRIRIVGPGRAGRSFAGALGAAGVEVDLLDRSSAVTDAASQVDALLIATPDRSISAVAASVVPGDAVVLHCSGASTLDVLAPHERRASVHPLMSLPNAEIGAARLSGGGWFAIAGDPAARAIVDLLGGRSFQIAEPDRTIYHATAAVSANHLVALLGQVERLAAQIGVPLQAFLDLAQGSFDDVVAEGARAALTGPTARGDHEVLQAHRRALPAAELALYDALSAAAAQLAAERKGS